MMSRARRKMYTTQHNVVLFVTAFVCGHTHSHARTQMHTNTQTQSKYSCRVCCVCVFVRITWCDVCVM